MKNYNEPKVELVKFNAEDIVKTSGLFTADVDLGGIDFAAKWSSRFE